LSSNRSSNRRRGRGGNRPQGGNQLNRIDNRARGNAPQMLEKYKKLAHDAAVNGDRVQSEYYLQFADHYFRVIADSKAQKDEQRARRDSERDQYSGDEGSDDENERQVRREQGGRRARNERPEPDEGERGAEGPESSAEEAQENPFTREKRGGSRRKAAARGNGSDDDSESTGLDPSALPPAIGKDEGEKKPRRTRRPRSSGDDDETLEAVG
jgi:hypothetical protein